MRLLFSQSLEELHENRDLPECQETRDVRLMTNVEKLNFLVEGCFHFAAVDDQSCASNISIFFGCTNVNTCYEINSVKIPLEIILLDDEIPDFFLFLLPLLSNFLWYLCL